LELEKIIKIEGSTAIQTEIAKQSNFEINSKLDGEPVERLQMRCYGVTPSSASDQTGSAVLDALETLHTAVGESSQKRVAVVKLGHHEIMDQQFESSWLEVLIDWSNAG
jgi:hypothetical protein